MQVPDHSVVLQKAETQSVHEDDGARASDGVPFFRDRNKVSTQTSQDAGGVQFNSGHVLETIVVAVA